MGYYSTFEVIDTDIPDILNVLNDLGDEKDWGHPGWEDYGNGIQGYDATKWYYWLTDLQDLATLYPDNYLVIEREGEDSLDVERAVIKNGTVTSVTPDVVWPKY